MSAYDTAVCSACQGMALPFGRMRHWFLLDEGGVLCLDCAKRLVPDRVANAGALSPAVTPRRLGPH